jgi:AraC-like DNA-binding protein
MSRHAMLVRAKSSRNLRELPRVPKSPAAESYLDIGNRGLFENSALPVTLHADINDSSDASPRWSHDRLTADTLLQLIDHLLEQRDLSTSAAANALGLQPRNLQRRLNRLGVSFHELVARRRYALAIRLLAEPLCQVSHIAERLGYPDVASFSRAFHRWHGKSLAQYQSDASVRGSKSIDRTAPVAEQRSLFSPGEQQVDNRHYQT